MKGLFKHLKILPLAQYEVGHHLFKWLELYDWCIWWFTEECCL